MAPIIYIRTLNMCWDQRNDEKSKKHRKQADYRRQSMEKRRNRQIPNTSDNLLKSANSVVWPKVHVWENAYHQMWKQSIESLNWHHMGETTIQIEWPGSQKLIGNEIENFSYIHHGMQRWVSFAVFFFFIFLNESDKCRQCRIQCNTKACY